MLAKSVASAGDVFGGTYQYHRVYVGGTVGVLGGGDGEREERAESERGERFDRAGRVCEGDVFGEEERDGERERNGGQSGDFEREENIRGCFR